MAKCVMCEKEVNGFYDYEGAKIPICFEHYEDGTFFSDYLAAQQSVQRTGGESAANLSLFSAEVQPPAKVTAKSTRR